MGAQGRPVGAWTQRRRTRAMERRAARAAYREAAAVEALSRTALRTTGKTRLHICVPIARRYTYNETHAFAKTVCQFLAEQHPDRLTTEWAVEKRLGKTFPDYNQNHLGATLASALQPPPHRAGHRHYPPTWRELERGVDPLTFTHATVPNARRSRTTRGRT